MRKIPSIALGLFLLLLLIPISKAQVYYVSECTRITEPGTYYLTQDIIDVGGNCFTIYASNVIFDCQGHTIDGVGGGYGIIASGNNITVKNCKISEFYGCLASADNNTIINNTITSCERYGIAPTNYNLITGNTISSSQTGIHPLGRYNLITGNTISSCYYGVKLQSEYNIFTKNIFTNNSFGMYLATAEENLIYNNFFNNSVNIQVEYVEYANYLNTTKQKGERIVPHPSGFIGGNYWTNPFGTGYSDVCDDEDGDGICDQPYVVAQNNIDYLPLSKYKPGVRPTPMQELLNAVLAIIIVFGTLTYSITLFLDKIRIK